MKNLLTLIALSSLVFLTACDPARKDTTVKHSEKAQTKTQPTDPIPKTITQQEVSRIALLEAKQLLAATAKNKKLDVTNAAKTNEEAKKLYANGEYKKAQITAVKVRHQLEELIINDLK